MILVTNLVRKLRPAAILILLAIAAGCSSANLGQIDETPSEREDMPGPGILSGDDGETALSWKSESKTATPAESVAGAAVLDDKTEFEQFKEWNKLRTEGAESEEYQDFLQWLEYQKFKASQ